MPTQPLSDEQLREAAALFQQHRSITSAAVEAKISRQQFGKRLKRAAERGLIGFRPVLPGYVLKAASTQLGPNGELQLEWIQQTKEPGEPFEVPAGHSIKGISALTNGEGRVVQQWIKTREEPNALDAIEAIKEALADCATRAPHIEPPTVSDDELATVYIAADWHIGLLSWHRETGQNYDLDIAQSTISGAVERLVASSPPSSQGIVLGLGDLLHSDGYDNATAKSKNILDVDGRYPKILKAATRLLITTVGLALTKHQSVLVRVLPGNHDIESAIAVSLALSMFYHDNPRVTVDDDPGYFWWWPWGTTLLGATHGDQAKMKDLPLIMATRNAEAWGQSKFRHILTGHIHTQTGIELSGVTVESFQTPAAPDAWHRKMGYGAGRSMTSITIHRERGEISRQKVNIL